MNPFEDYTVTEPRRIVDTSEEINKDALEKVVASFRRMENQPLPRLLPAADICLITSAEPGYGKSHLIGRIFQALNPVATLVYLRPFGSPETCWQDILNRLARELEYPDRADAVACMPGEPTQLDCVIRSTFGYLLARLVTSGRIGSTDPEADARDLRADPVLVLAREEMQRWIISEMETLIDQFDIELQRDGIELSPSSRAWIRVLLTYMISGSQPSVRQLCRDWLMGKPLADGDLSKLGLKASDNIEPDLSLEGRNERCFERLRDFCLISSFYHPILFCFDQTELYNRSEALAKSFGMVLSRFRREVVNHFTLVTSNQDVWQKTLHIHFEAADQQCISPRTALSGVHLAEARSVIKKRLESANIPDERQKRFLEGTWLTRFFSNVSQRSARSVLRLAATEWSGTPQMAPSLEDLYEGYRLEVLGKPRGLDFDPGIFQRVLHEVFAIHPKARSEAFKSNKGYLSLKWAASDPRLLFGLEEGNSYLRWQAIIREARRYHEQANKSGFKLKTVCLRTSELRSFGEKTQSEINTAEKESILAIIILTKLETAEFYAANELFAAASQGDIEGHTVDDALAFLSEKLKHWVARFTHEKSSTIPLPIQLPSSKLTDALLIIISKGGLMPWPVVERRLLKEDLKVTREEVLLECSKLADRIAVFSSPTNSVFRWIK